MRKLVCDICGKGLDMMVCYDENGYSQYVNVEIRNSRKHGAEYDICNNCYEDISKYVKEKGREGETHTDEERLQGEWIPASERLPNDRDWYLGIFQEPDTGFVGIPYICDYVGKVTKGTTNEGWILRQCTDVDSASDYFHNLICIAWQPLPKPYQKGGAEND